MHRGEFEFGGDRGTRARAYDRCRQPLADVGYFTQFGHARPQGRPGTTEPLEQAAEDARTHAAHQVQGEQVAGVGVQIVGLHRMASSTARGGGLQLGQNLAHVQFRHVVEQGDFAQAARQDEAQLSGDGLFVASHGA